MTSTQRIVSLLLSLLLCTSLYAGLNKAAPKGDAKKAAKSAKKAAPKKIEFAPAPVPERFLASCYSKGIVVIVGKDGRSSVRSRASRVLKTHGC